VHCEGNATKEQKTKHIDEEKPGSNRDNVAREEEEREGSVSEREVAWDRAALTG
jgi:hypothetical protein